MSKPLTGATVVLVCCVMGLTSAPANAQSESDPKAVEVANRLMDAMGGKETWDAQRVLSFRFAVVREEEELSNWFHIWDRNTGQYRLEGETKDGDFLRVLFNVNSREGEVWLGADKVPPEEAGTYLERAYGRFINDTYWLLMPWKWLDPGVHLAYEGEETVDGVVHDVVRLSFDSGIGLTSADQYWGYVSRESGLMTRWEFLLQDEEAHPGAGDRSAFTWEDWKVVGEDGIKLAGSKVRVAEGPRVAITFPLMQISREVDDAMFNPPPPPAEAPR